MNRVCVWSKIGDIGHRNTLLLAGRVRCGIDRWNGRCRWALERRKAKKCFRALLSELYCGLCRFRGSGPFEHLNRWAGFADAPVIFCEPWRALLRKSMPVNLFRAMVESLSTRPVSAGPNLPEVQLRLRCVDDASMVNDNGSLF